MNIFQDLQIDYSNMMNDPQDFHAQCVREADKLRDILKADISPESVLKGIVAENEVTPNELKHVQTVIDEVYNIADDQLSVVAMLELASQLKKLAKDLEYLARDKVMLQISKDNEGQIDKALAFDLYKELRERHNNWYDSMEMLSGFDAEIASKLDDVSKLPALPGNYSKGPQNLAHYIYRIDDDEDIFRMHYGVLRELNKRFNLDLNTTMNMMDAHDFFKANPQYNVHITQRAD
jgi:hypothetical protein